MSGNALQKPDELFADTGVPIFIPMNQDHSVDDCVGLNIGGRECNYQEQCRVAGTFFMIPGWTRHWKELFEKEYGKFDVEFARRLFHMSNYERALLIPNPDKPERIATKAPRHKKLMFIIIKLRVLVAKIFC